MTRKQKEGDGYGGRLAVCSAWGLVVALPSLGWTQTVLSMDNPQGGMGYCHLHEYRRKPPLHRTAETYKHEVSPYHSECSRETLYRRNPTPDDRHRRGSYSCMVIVQRKSWLTIQTSPSSKSMQLSPNYYVHQEAMDAALLTSYTDTENQRRQHTPHPKLVSACLCQAE